MNCMVLLPSATTWWTVSPMEQPELGKRVNCNEIRSDAGNSATRGWNSAVSLGWSTMSSWKSKSDSAMVSGTESPSV